MPARKKKDRSEPKKKRNTIEKIEKKYHDLADKRKQALDYLASHSKESRRSVGLKFHIPHTTMNRLATHETKVDTRVGRKPIFEVNEENELKRWIFEMVNRGFTVTEKMVLDKANKMKRQKFGDNTKVLTKGWYSDFRDRNHDIVVRVQEHLDQNRTKAEDKKVVGVWFDTLKDIIKTNNLSASQIYNCDETGIARNLSKTYTLAQKGSRSVQGEVPVNRSLSTLLVACNAKGDVLSPFFIHPGKKTKSIYFSEKIPTACVGTSDSGFMTSQLFQQWFSKHFVKHCVPERPVLLIVDGHSSHIDFQLLEIARDNEIILMTLPPHTSHLYQPLDVGVFGPLKTCFRDLMSTFILENPEKPPTTSDFVDRLYDTFIKAVTFDHVISGFVGACIYPWNKTKALEKLVKPIKMDDDEKVTTLYSNLLPVPTRVQREELPDIKTTSVLTSDEYYEKAKKQKQEKEQKEKDKEEKKRKRVEKKKEREEVIAQKKVVKRQKSNGIFCTCRSACMTNHKCVCKSGGRCCSEDCSCHGRCQNVANIINKPTTSATTKQTLCCYSRCQQLLDQTGSAQVF